MQTKRRRKVFRSHGQGGSRRTYVRRDVSAGETDANGHRSAVEREIGNCHDDRSKMFGTLKMRITGRECSRDREISLGDEGDKGRSHSSLWSRFRSSYDGIKRRLVGGGGGHSEGVSASGQHNWMRTASLQRWMDSLSRKREHPPETPPKLPPKTLSKSAVFQQCATPPPRRRRRRNRSGSQMSSIFFISLEHRSKSMQSLMNDRREEYLLRSVGVTPPPRRRRRSATPSAQSSHRNRQVTEQKVGQQSSKKPSIVNCKAGHRSIRLGLARYIRATRSHANVTLNC